MCRDSNERRDQLLFWSGAAKRRAGCAALREGPKLPSPRCLPLVWRRRYVLSAPQGRVNLSRYFVPDISHCDRLLLLYESTSTYARRGARRVCSCWSLGPGPLQRTAIWPRRDASPTDRASGARQRRYTAVSPSNSSIVLLLLLLLLAIVDNILNLETMPFFDLIIL